MDSRKNLKPNELTISSNVNDKSLVYSISSSGTSLYTPINTNPYSGARTWTSPSLELSKEGLKFFALKTTISKVIFSGPATTVFFSDGTKRSVKMASNTEYPYSVYDDREVAMMYAVLKRFMGGKWRKELRRYHYALECSIPIAVIEEYCADLDHAYLRTMVERLDRDLQTEFMPLIFQIDYLRNLKWGEFEWDGKLTINAEDCDVIFTKRRNNG